MNHIGDDVLQVVDEIGMTIVRKDDLAQILNAARLHFEEFYGTHRPDWRDDTMERFNRLEKAIS